MNVHVAAFCDKTATWTAKAQKAVLILGKSKIEDWRKPGSKYCVRIGMNVLLVVRSLNASILTCRSATSAAPNAVFDLNPAMIAKQKANPQ